MAAASASPLKAATVAETAKPAVAKKTAAVLYVLDTTANATEPKRTHEMIVDGAIKSFDFMQGVSLPLPPPIALRFLKTPSFMLTDDKGTVQPFRRRPKQPDELEAGETLVLKDEETVARFEELSTAALQHRVLEMPASEHFADNPSRTAMIAFIVATKVKAREANTSKVKDVGKDEFVPEDLAIDEGDGE